MIRFAIAGLAPSVETAILQWSARQHRGRYECA